MLRVTEVQRRERISGIVHEHHVKPPKEDKHRMIKYKYIYQNNKDA